MLEYYDVLAEEKSIVLSLSGGGQISGDRLMLRRAVDAAVEAGADAIGFVFYPPSPRALSAQRAGELARRIPPFIDVVGLFVNESPEMVLVLITRRSKAS